MRTNCDKHPELPPSDPSDLPALFPVMFQKAGRVSREVLFSSKRQLHNNFHNFCVCICKCKSRNNALLHLTPRSTCSSLFSFLNFIVHIGVITPVALGNSFLKFFTLTLLKDSSKFFCPKIWILHKCFPHLRCCFQIQKFFSCHLERSFLATRHRIEHHFFLMGFLYKYASGSPYRFSERSRLSFAVRRVRWSQSSPSARHAGFVCISAQISDGSFDSRSCSLVIAPPSPSNHGVQQ